MALLLLVVIGAVLGWLATIITRTDDRNGILTDVGIGLAGSLLAGLIANNGTVIGGLSAVALLAAIAGSVVLLAIFHLFQRNRANA